MEIVGKLEDGRVAFEIEEDDEAVELRADCAAAIGVLLDTDTVVLPRIWRRAIANLVGRLAP